MLKEETFKIGETTHYRNGNYELKDEGIGIKGNIYEYHDIVGCQFNQLKAKLFNLVESTATNEVQMKAMNGLVKDFCNYQYNNVVLDIEAWMRRMGFDIPDTPQTARPLESQEL